MHSCHESVFIDGPFLASLCFFACLFDVGGLGPEKLPGKKEAERQNERNKDRTTRSIRAKSSVIIIIIIIIIIIRAVINIKLAPGSDPPLRPLGLTGEVLKALNLSPERGAHDSPPQKER